LKCRTDKPGPSVRIYWSSAHAIASAAVSIVHRGTDKGKVNHHLPDKLLEGVWNEKTRARRDSREIP